MKTILLDPYPGTLKYYTDEKQFDAARKRYFGMDSNINAYNGYMTFGDSGTDRLYLVYSNVDDSPALAHELAHVIFNLFDYIGLPVSVDTDESFAYMLSYLMGRCIENEKDIRSGSPSSEGKLQKVSGTGPRWNAC